jgi:hypothetical protein
MSMFSSVLDRVQLPLVKLYEFVYEYADAYAYCMSIFSSVRVLLRVRTAPHV